MATARKIIFAVITRCSAFRLRYRAQRELSCADLSGFFGERKLPLARLRFRFGLRARLVRRRARIGQLHPDEFADAALFHRHAIKHVGLRDRALVVGDDDELALRDESVQHADEPIDVGFVERRIHFVEDAERARPHHVDGEEQRDRRHGALAAGEERNALQLFAGQQ